MPKESLMETENQADGMLPDIRHRVTLGHFPVTRARLFAWRNFSKDFK